MAKKEKMMENKKNLSKQAKIIIAVIAALLIIASIVLTIVFVSIDKNHTALNKEEPNVSETPNEEENKEDNPPISDETGMAGGEKTEFDEVISLVGNTTLSPEREVLLEPNIIKTIEHSNSKLPILNENGSYYTDTEGNLSCYDIEVRDYTGMKENLIVIVNAMADAGYPIEPIWYAQRLYFECYDMIDKLETEVLLERIMSVFAKSGNTVESVGFLAKEYLEIERTDNCAFVFNDIIPPADITPRMNEVECNIEYVWEGSYNEYLIYDRWIFEHGESEYDNNLLRYMQIIVSKMIENGASEFDIKLGQLIYSSYLADVKYNSEWLSIILDAFELGTPDYVLLCENMHDIFGVDMNSNQEIADYYDGISSYLGGEA